MMDQPGGRPLWRRFLGHRRANAATEFALVLPVMLLLIGGIVEFGRVFQVYNAVNRLATRYATTYADCYDSPAGACGTELLTYASPAAIKNLVPQLTSTPTLRMVEVLMSNGTPSTPTIVYASPTGTTALTAGELQQARTAIAPGQYGVVVTVSYTHTLVFFAPVMAQFFGNATTRLVTYTVAQRKT